MRKRFYAFLTALALLLWGLPLQAQWSGSADLSGGIGGMSGSIVNDEQPMLHWLAKGVFQANYISDKLTWNTTLNGEFEPKTTDNTRLSYKDGKLNITYKAATTRPLTASLKSDFKWMPSPLRNYSAWILYRYKNDNAYNHSLSFDGSMEDMENLSYYYEVPVMNEHKVETGVRTSHDFDDGRHILQSSLSFQAINSDKINTWTVLKTNPGDQEGGAAIDIESIKGYAWKYRITPTSTDLNFDGDIHLHNTLLDNGARLRVTPGMRFSTKHSLDRNSGATRIDLAVDETSGQWRDSTRLRENFDFLSVQIDNYLQAELHWMNLEAHADYSLQVYGRRLNDDDHQQPLKVKGLYPVGKSNVKWNISPVHSLNLINEMSVKHPDYLKVCWYDRSAGYLDQLYRGNEQLISPQTMLYTLEYELNWKRFLSRTAVTYKDIINEIDQTWTNEEIEGRQYKVFHWINSADSRTVGFTQKLGWRGEVITANAGVTYNQSLRTSNRTGATKKAHDWKLTGDITARLGDGWSVGVDAKYQSKVATFFTIFKEYCELNAFVQKEFKSITVYLKGKDLLDTPRETSFESEETQEYWVEQVRSNRRVILLGAKWRF